MIRLLIFPHNGSGLEALDALAGNYKLVGFIDDEASKQGKHANGYEVFGREALKLYPDARVLAVPGSPWTFRDRKKIIEGLQIPAERFVTVIHPRASVSPLAKIGKNNLLLAGVVITSNAKIGDHVCILPNSVVHHDVEVGDFTMIAANVTLAGYAKIGKNCYLGAAVSVSNRVEVGDGAMLGMAANVIRSVEAGATVAGNPAKPLSTLPKPSF